jgi:hypothetical protein
VRSETEPRVESLNQLVEEALVLALVGARQRGVRTSLELDRALPVVGGFEFAGRLVLGVGAVVEAAIGERAAQAFVEEQEEERDLNAFGGETIGVAGAVALQQSVAFELAQVVAELV